MQSPVPTYGVPWNADNVANLEVGELVGRTISYRFRAEHSAALEAVRVFLVFRTICAGCYARGDGGQVRVALHSDDGSEQHLPLSRVLSSALVADPMAQWNRLIKFDKPVPLEAGRLYHLVFSNPAPDSVNNYVSVDDLYNLRRAPGIHPGVSDKDLAVLWKRSAQTPWEVNYGHTPIFLLCYADGKRQGQGYIDVRLSYAPSISGVNRVRETFTVRGPDKLVSQVAVRVKKLGKPGDLHIDLEDSRGNLIEAGVVLASSLDDNGGVWAVHSFSARRTLRSGETFRVVVSAPPGDAYQLYVLQKGTAYGFDGPSVFEDGYLQSGTRGQWEDFKGRRDLDMEFYFVLSR